jgi:asparagine synthase (glutamine-hydrolysing)
VPLDAWLKTPLRGWVEDLLSPTALKASGVLHDSTIDQAQQMRERHMSGLEKNGFRLWPLLMFQSWVDTNL